MSCSVVNNENMILGPCCLPYPLLPVDILLLPEATAGGSYNMAEKGCAAQADDWGRKRKRWERNRRKRTEKKMKRKKRIGAGELQINVFFPLHHTN